MCVYITGSDTFDYQNLLDHVCLVFRACRGHTNRPRARYGPGPRAQGSLPGQGPGPKAPGHKYTAEINPDMKAERRQAPMQSQGGEKTSRAGLRLGLPGSKSVQIERAPGRRFSQATRGRLGREAAQIDDFRPYPSPPPRKNLKSHWTALEQSKFDWSR